jgi:hypothetical protein
LERVRGREVRLAEQRRVVAGRGQLPGEAACATSGSRSMPLSCTPWVSGSSPVRIEARAGWQTGFGVMQVGKRVPLLASWSR